MEFLFLQRTSNAFSPLQPIRLIAIAETNSPVSLPVQFIDLRACYSLCRARSVSDRMLAKQDNELVVYSALDREFSQPILEDLGEELQMQVRVKYDQESNKTVGTGHRVNSNSTDSPKRISFGTTKFLHTLRLEKLGLLEPISEADLSRFPASVSLTGWAVVWICGAGQSFDCEYGSPHLIQRTTSKLRLRSWRTKNGLVNARWLGPFWNVRHPRRGFAQHAWRRARPTAY